ncbi:MAG: hypothetical protein P8N76_15715 [Pirellulaceae bacterium]|nr:hypothetical protein [Pirellulaceae bacterium]
MNTETASRTPPSKTEVITVISVVILLLALLVPAIAISRENARAFFCQENLRRLDEALVTYHSFQGKNPNIYSWPLDLLPMLEKSQPKYSASGMPMQEPRPTFLTCPANPASKVETPFDQIGLYVAIQSLDKNGAETWIFRDRSIEPVETPMDHWCVGIVLDEAEAAAQLQRPGPHQNHSYQQSNGDGGYTVVPPDS